MRAGILALAAFAAAALFAVSGCQTMSAEDCAAADWAALGYQDAASGGAERIAARTESCARAQVTPDADAYRNGFARGMVEFCQPPHGFTFASNGGTFNGQCPDALDKDFRAAYFDGQEVRRAEQAATDARSRVSTMESRIQDIDHQLATDHPGNVRLIAERDGLLRQLPGARREIGRYEADARRVRYELSSRWR